MKMREMFMMLTGAVKRTGLWLHHQAKFTVSWDFVMRMKIAPCNHAQNSFHETLQ
jgi:hypothetical protein